MVKSLTLNPYMSLLNLKLWTHIWPTNINFSPPYIGLFGPSWSELSPRVICRGGARGVDWAGDKKFILSRTDRNVREARLKILYFSHGSTNLSQTFRLCMWVYRQHILQILLKYLIWFNRYSSLNCIVQLHIEYSRIMNQILQSFSSTAQMF